MRIGEGRTPWIVLTLLTWSLLLIGGAALKAAAGLAPGLPGPSDGSSAAPAWMAPLVVLTAAMAQADTAFEHAVRASVLVEDGPRQWLAVLSRPGDGPVMGLVCVLGAAWLWRAGETGWAWRLPMAAAVHGALIRLVKAWVDRPRPAHQDDAWVLVSGASFPSGHAAGGLFVYGLLALLIWTVRPAGARGLDGRRIWAGAVCLAIGLWAGLTRPLLLVHHPSDLVGGWLLACGMLSLVWMTRPRVCAAPVSRRAG